MTKEKGKKHKKRKAKKDKQKKFSFFSFVIRLSIFLILTLSVIVVGLVVGYSIIGDGDLADVFRIETWKHVFDIVFKE